MRTHGIRVQLLNSHSAAGSYLFLSIARGTSKTQIEEPRPIGLIRRRYRTPEEQALAERMRGLESQVRRLCLARQMNAYRDHELIHEALIQQLLFGVSGKMRA